MEAKAARLRSAAWREHRADSMSCGNADDCFACTLHVASQLRCQDYPPCHLGAQRPCRTFLMPTIGQCCCMSIIRHIERRVAYQDCFATERCKASCGCQIVRLAAYPFLMAPALPMTSESALIHESSGMSVAAVQSLQCSLQCSQQCSVQRVLPPTAKL